MKNHNTQLQQGQLKRWRDQLDPHVDLPVSLVDERDSTFGVRHLGTLKRNERDAYFVKHASGRIVSIPDSTPLTSSDDGVVTTITLLHRSSIAAMADAVLSL